MKLMRSSIVILAIILLSLGIASNASADIPLTINYQGWLTTTDGTPVASEVYLMKFVIYDAGTSGSELWNSGFQTVQVTIGLFDLQLGGLPMPPLPDNLFATSDTRYLGITIGTDSEITPRTPITSASYCFQALRADTASLATEIDQKGAEIGQVLVWSESGWSPSNVATGDITAVYADEGLTGGGTDGGVHLNVGAGDGIEVTSSTVSVDVNDFAGNGLTETSNNLHIGAGDGIDVTSNSVSVDVSDFVGNGLSESSNNLNIGSNSVTSTMIQNSTIQLADIGQNGATNGEYMKWNGSAWVTGKPGFPTPDYEFGWFYLGTNGTTTLTYDDLGGSAEDYLVQLQFKDIDNSLGVNNKYVGGEIYYNASSYRDRGAYYYNLTSTSISIKREDTDYSADSIRVRIWVTD